MEKTQIIKREIIKAKLKNFFNKNPKTIAKILAFLIKREKNV